MYPRDSGKNSQENVRTPRALTSVRQSRGHGGKHIILNYNIRTTLLKAGYKKEGGLEEEAWMRDRA